MSKTEFKGRSAELKLLDELWASSSASLLILYGRRRVGKTRLLTHWMARHAARAIYWVAEPTSEHDQLRSFSQALYNFSHPDPSAPLDFSYASWEQAFQQAATLAKNERLALFIDEVTYMIDVNPSITGILQKAWDHWLSSSHIILALSGSQMGMMQDMLSYEAPLYGRATAHLRLPPLPFNVTAEFFPNYSVFDRLTIYAMFGGIPAYWERFNPERSVMENISAQLLTSNTLLQEEPRLLLQDFINDPHYYLSILRAIAHGAETQHLIAKRTGLASGHVSKYLSVLRDTGFVERRVPITDDPATSRRGHYFVTDAYLRFYYRFLASYQAQLAIGEQHQARISIEKHMPEFIENYTWPEMCREWLLRAGGRDELPFSIQSVGSVWRRTHQFEVAGIDVEAKNMVLGRCLWRDEPVGLDNLAVADFVQEARELVPRNGEWTVYFIGFAAGGWTEEAQAQANEFVGKRSKNWHSVGIRLLDLNQVDATLTTWITSNL